MSPTSESPEFELSETYIGQCIRPRFSRVLAREEVYLANHSLGRPLDRTFEDVKRGLDLWYEKVDDSWDTWTKELDLWRGSIARLLGFSRFDCVIPKTSAGQGLRAVLNAFPHGRPVKVLTTTGEFDSIDFILKAYSQLGRVEVVWIEPSNYECDVPIFETPRLIDAINKDRFDLVVASKVFFSTSQILRDCGDLIEAAHQASALVMLDVYHAAGVIPLHLDAEGADFAIGGSYKYLRGGPGACYLAIAPRHLNESWRTLDTGWFAKRDVFDYRRTGLAEFAEGGNAWLESTPPVLMPYQAKAGLEFTLEAGVENIRDYNLQQQARMREAVRKHGVELFEPSDPQNFGAFSLMMTERAELLRMELKNAGVNVDARGNFVRFGPDLLNTEEEFKRAAIAIAKVVKS